MTEKVAKQIPGEDTLPKLLKRNAEQFGAKIAMRTKGLGIWTTYSWQDYYDMMKYFSLGLVSMGVQPGEKVAIIGDSDPEWFWAEEGIQATGVVPVGIFADCVISEVRYIIGDSGAKIIVARDQEQVDKCLALKEEMSIEKVIYWDDKGLWNYHDPILISFNEVIKQGRKYDKDHPGVFEQNLEKGKGDDIAALLYTSGTSGAQKGVLLSHENLITSVAGWRICHPLKKGSQYVSTISPAWSAEQWLALAGPLHGALTVNFVEGADTMQADMREIGPEELCGPPRVFENWASRIQAGIMNSGRFNRFMYNLCLPIGYKIADIESSGKQPNLLQKAVYRLCYLLVFRPLLDKLGLLQVISCGSSGGYMAPEVFRYLHAIGIDIMQMYGISEAGVAASHVKDDIDFKTVGRPTPWVEARISEEGEIAFRSPKNFRGYHNNPELTNKSLKNGWFYTGDAGYITGGGHITIIDRMADLKQLATGIKYSPAYIEGNLRFSPYITNAVCIGGEEDPDVSLLLGVDFDVLSKWAEEQKMAFTTYADLSQKPQVHDLIEGEIQKVNKFLPKEARVVRFLNLYKDLDADESELTRTKKLRRGYLEGRYQELIDALHGGKEETIVEGEVKYRDGRTAIIKMTIRVRTIK